MQSIKKKHAPWATSLGYLGLLLWTLAALFAAYTTRLPTFEILSMILGMSGLFSVCYLTFTKNWHRIRQPWWIWLLGVTGIFGNDILYISAFKYAPAAQADLINYLWPIFVLLLTGFLPRESFSARHILAGFFGLLGCYYLLTEGEGLNGFQYDYWPGYLLAFADAVVWSLFTLASRRYAHTPPEMVGLYCGIGALFSCCIHGVYESWITPTLFETGILILMGMTTQGAAYFLWDYGVKRGNFKLLNVLSYGNPIISVLLLILCGLAEAHATLWLSCAFVTLGSIMASIPENWLSPTYWLQQLWPSTQEQKLSLRTR